MFSRKILLLWAFICILASSQGNSYNGNYGWSPSTQHYYNQATNRQYYSNGHFNQNYYPTGYPNYNWNPMSHVYQANRFHPQTFGYSFMGMDLYSLLGLGRSNILGFGYPYTHGSLFPHFYGFPYFSNWMDPFSSYMMNLYGYSRFPYYGYGNHYDIYRMYGYGNRFGGFGNGLVNGYGTPTLFPRPGQFGPRFFPVNGYQKPDLLDQLGIHGVGKDIVTVVGGALLFAGLLKIG